MTVPLVAARAVSADGLSSSYPNDIPLLRSCENCRRKKRKCSGNKPTCTRCKAQGEACVYRPTARFFKPRHSETTTRKRASLSGPCHTIGKARQRSKSTQKKPHSIHEQTLAPADLMLRTPEIDMSQSLLLQGGPLPLSPAAYTGAPDLVSLVTDGLSYMSTASVDELSHMSASPEMPLNPDFPFASPTTVLTPGPAITSSPGQMPIVMQTQQQQQQFQNSVAAAAAVLAGTPSTTPTSSVFPTDYSQLLASALTQPGSLAAASLAASCAMSASPDNLITPMLYSPPRTAQGSLGSNVGECSPYMLYTTPNPTVPSLPSGQSLLGAQAALATSGVAMVPGNAALVINATMPQSTNLFPEWFA
ncbi:hypothetical protein FBU59_000444 [Linderina macrospora]|uniref:Uncharacterized protein n=1 Tax=Linderina macrospora TaxID=4868 RepID=A0ACC1JGL8_9FUNG|nr:hypothetical protein FBU59_000444 [Linderina macrospora]